jgi:hypothetical protein
MTTQQVFNLNEEFHLFPIYKKNENKIFEFANTSINDVYNSTVKLYSIDPTRKNNQEIDLGSLRYTYYHVLLLIRDLTQYENIPSTSFLVYDDLNDERLYRRIADRILETLPIFMNLNDSYAHTITQYMRFINQSFTESGDDELRIYLNAAYTLVKGGFEQMQKYIQLNLFKYAHDGSRIEKMEAFIKKAGFNIQLIKPFLTDDNRFNSHDQNGKIIPELKINFIKLKFYILQNFILSSDIFMSHYSNDQAEDRVYAKILGFHRAALEQVEKLSSYLKGEEIKDLMKYEDTNDNDINNPNPNPNSNAPNDTMNNNSNPNSNPNPIINDPPINNNNNNNSNFNSNTNTNSNNNVSENFSDILSPSQNNQTNVTSTNPLSNQSVSEQAANDLDVSSGITNNNNMDSENLQTGDTANQKLETQLNEMNVQHIEYGENARYESYYSKANPDTGVEKLEIIIEVPQPKDLLIKIKPDDVLYTFTNSKDRDNGEIEEMENEITETLSNTESFKRKILKSSTTFTSKLTTAFLNQVPETTELKSKSKKRKEPEDRSVIEEDKKQKTNKRERMSEYAKRKHKNESGTFMVNEFKNMGAIYLNSAVHERERNLNADENTYKPGKVYYFKCQLNESSPAAYYFIQGSLNLTAANPQRVIRWWLNTYIQLSKNPNLDVQLFNENIAFVQNANEKDMNIQQTNMNTNGDDEGNDININPAPAPATAPVEDMNIRGGGSAPPVDINMGGVSGSAPPPMGGAPPMGGLPPTALGPPPAGGGAPPTPIAIDNPIPPNTPTQPIIEPTPQNQNTTIPTSVPLKKDAPTPPSTPCDIEKETLQKENKELKKKIEDLSKTEGKSVQLEPEAKEAINDMKMTIDESNKNIQTHHQNVNTMQQKVDQDIAQVEAKIDQLSIESESNIESPNIFNSSTKKSPKNPSTKKLSKIPFSQSPKKVSKNSPEQSPEQSPQIPSIPVNQTIDPKAKEKIKELNASITYLQNELDGKMDVERSELSKLELEHNLNEAKRQKKELEDSQKQDKQSIITLEKEKNRLQGIETVKKDISEENDQLIKQRTEIEASLRGILTQMKSLFKYEYDKAILDESNNSLTAIQVLTSNINKAKNHLKEVHEKKVNLESQLNDDKKKYTKKENDFIKDIEKYQEQIEELQSLESQNSKMQEQYDTAFAELESKIKELTDMKTKHDEERQLWAALQSQHSQLAIYGKELMQTLGGDNANAIFKNLDVMQYSHAESKQLRDRLANAIKKFMKATTGYKRKEFDGFIKDLYEVGNNLNKQATERLLQSFNNDQEEKVKALEKKQDNKEYTEAYSNILLDFQKQIEEAKNSWEFQAKEFVSGDKYINKKMDAISEAMGSDGSINPALSALPSSSMNTSLYGRAPKSIEPFAGMNAQQLGNLLPFLQNSGLVPGSGFGGVSNIAGGLGGGGSTTRIVEKGPSFETFETAFTIIDKIMEWRDEKISKGKIKQFRQSPAQSNNREYINEDEWLDRGKSKKKNPNKEEVKETYKQPQFKTIVRSYNPRRKKLKILTDEKNKETSRM